MLRPRYRLSIRSRNTGPRIKEKLRRSPCPRRVDARVCSRVPPGGWIGRGVHTGGPDTRVPRPVCGFQRISRPRLFDRSRTGEPVKRRGGVSRKPPIFRRNQQKPGRHRSIGNGFGFVRARFVLFRATVFSVTDVERMHAIFRDCCGDVCDF